MSSKKPAAKAPAKPAQKPAAKPAVPEFIDHVVEQVDLDNNAELVEQGVKVGDTIQIPNPEYVKPAEKSKFPAALVETIKEHNHINCAWVNDNGEWYFADRPGFTAYSREEIING
jgi:hypothetical protein